MTGMAKKQPPSKNARSGAARAPFRTLYLVKQVQYKTFLRLEAALQPLGVTTTQFRILTALSRGDNKRSSAELSRLFGVKPQTMIKQIVNLEGNGLIERNLAKGSKRVLEVSMTEAGRGTLRACDKAATAVEAAIFASFEPGELESYRALMEKVLAGLHDIPDNEEE
ncbi:MarR family winged helix-turn-helix transcriptional regulator [Peristeroidobacter soli]|jgi:DNA-binding MarR family transcriptional regulator|uniref:MarR family winged helix-turn-helix transcriptional regulator n=1 Tax=Peristeroidobacter soli TaxID=2497877 RepID=UPI00130021EB|nr:MarR family transcriptional regulator [Peristeroidobacter soli]